MNPLVSVIVRTMGRPELARALDSVAAQTHRPIEIVIVDAADAGLAMHERSGLPVRVVRKGRLARVQLQVAPAIAVLGAAELEAGADHVLGELAPDELHDARRRRGVPVGGPFRLRSHVAVLGLVPGAVAAKDRPHALARLRRPPARLLPIPSLTRR